MQLNKLEKRIAIIASVFTVITELVKHFESLKNLYRRYVYRNTYSITIESCEDIYADVLMWVQSNCYKEDIRDLSAYYNKHNEKNLISFLVNENLSETFYDSGVKIYAEINSKSKKDNDGGQVTANDVFAELIESFGTKSYFLHLTVRDEKSLTFLKNKIEEISKIRHERDNPSSFYLLTRWGEWDKKGDVPSRALNSVILKEGQLDRIYNDVVKFYASEEIYKRYSIPYHRGYLFYGPPGTGKTSIAKAIGDTLNLDVYYACLSDLEKDGILIDIVSRVKPRSILLLEDIDSLHSATSRNDVDNKTTISGLLNALDGFATPNGVIIIMTTNHMERLDEAILRSGRVDLVEEVDYLNQYQFDKIFEFFYNRVSGLELTTHKVTSSTLIEIIKKHHDCFEEGVAQTQKMLSDL